MVLALYLDCCIKCLGTMHHQQGHLFMAPIEGFVSAHHVCQTPTAVGPARFCSQATPK